MDRLPGGNLNAPLLHPPVPSNGLTRTELELQLVDCVILYRQTELYIEDIPDCLSRVASAPLHSSAYSVSADTDSSGHKLRRWRAADEERR